MRQTLAVKNEKHLVCLNTKYRILAHEKCQKKLTTKVLKKNGKVMYTCTEKSVILP